MNDITIKTSEYRPCYVNGKKALFHKWVEYAKPLAPSMSIIGDKGGQLWYTIGLIEFEDGRIEEVQPSNIRFADGLINQYTFKEEIMKIK